MYSAVVGQMCHFKQHEANQLNGFLWMKYRQQALLIAIKTHREGEVAAKLS